MKHERIQHRFHHEWHVAINKFTGIHNHDGHSFMYEAMSAADEIPRLKMLFER